VGNPATVTMADGSKLTGTLVRKDDWLVILTLPDGTRKSMPRNNGVPKVDVKPEELKLAMQLMEQNIQGDFHPERYKDTVRERMLEIIQQKVEGQEITFGAAEEPKAQIIDLMDALKASLGVESGEGRKPSKASKPAEDRKPARRSPRGHAKVEAPKKRGSR